MATAFPRFQLWLWGGKQDKAAIIDESSVNYSADLNFGWKEHESMRFPAVKGPKVTNPPRKIKKKRHSREDRLIDREHDIVIVPSDGVCLSGSESDDSDWSIGWLEPHGSEFLSDDETDDSFAVLVPCYRHNRNGKVLGKPNGQLLQNLTNEHFADGKDFIAQWLTSLNNC